MIIDQFLEHAEIPALFAVTDFFHDAIQWMFHLVDGLRDPNIDPAFQDDVELVAFFTVADDEGVLGQ